MQFEDATYYQALLARDRRFDGVFFTCVTSTGIYCRPICSAITPKQSNCRFVATSIEAEMAGFRPCLRCRPELAPAVVNFEQSLPAHRLAAYIDETLLIDETLGEAAHKSDLSERQLRRLFVQTFGIEPKRYVTSRRLLFAKQLLQDTTLPIAHVAASAGFNDRGRLTLNMKQIYGLTPDRFRKDSAAPLLAQPLILRADYRPPFNWQALLEFLKNRVTPLERVAADTYFRQIGKYEISVKNISEKNHLLITIPLELSRQSHTILKKVRRLFDLDANPFIIEKALSHDPLLKSLIQTHPGLRVPGCWDNFEMLLRTIIGQQVSVAAATTVMRRLVDQLGHTPEAIMASSPERIASLGMPLKRARALWDIAILVQKHTLNLEEKHPDIFYNHLIALPGIGSWTAEYLRLRVLHWPDAFPAGDLGLQKAIISGRRLSQKQLLEHAASWHPWRSYATMLLWRSLQDNGG